MLAINVYFLSFIPLLSFLFFSLSIYTNSLYSAHGFSHVTIIMVTFICFWFCRFLVLAYLRVCFIRTFLPASTVVCVMPNYWSWILNTITRERKPFAGAKSNCCFYSLFVCHSVKLNIHTIIYAILGIKSIWLHSFASLFISISL